MGTVIKHSYLGIDTDERARALAHVDYICGRPEKTNRPHRFFFNNDRNDISKKEVQEAVKNESRSRVSMHKLMMSPGCDTDVRRFVRNIMSQLSSQKGQDLTWFGVIHKNTSHVHAHIVLLGTDQAGKAVRIDREDYKIMRQAGNQFLWRMRDYRFRERESKTKDWSKVMQLVKPPGPNERLINATATGHASLMTAQPAVPATQQFGGNPGRKILLALRPRTIKMRGEERTKGWLIKLIRTKL